MFADARGWQGRGRGTAAASPDTSRQAELTAKRTDLVLEQARAAARRCSLKSHVIRQAADVVVALDDGRIARAGLDNVGIDRALGEELRHPAELFGLFLKDADELRADDLALVLRIGDARERREEPLRRVDADKVDVRTCGRRASTSSPSFLRIRPWSTKTQVS